MVERAVVLATGTSVDIPEDLLREGRRVGGYTLERQLGSGGMGEVWLARHALLARPSAVKLIRQQALAGRFQAREMLEQRFQREAQATSQLRSPHTVELYDFGVTEDGDFYYVMEYLNGVDLESLVTKFGPVDPARAVFFLRQACMSLGEAHAGRSCPSGRKACKPFRLPSGSALRLSQVARLWNREDDQRCRSNGHRRRAAQRHADEFVARSRARRASRFRIGHLRPRLCRVLAAFREARIRGGHRHGNLGPTCLAAAERHCRSTDRICPAELDELVLRCLAKNPADRPSSAFELGERLASIPLEDSWDQRRAEAWWTENMPDINHDGSTESVSETMVWGRGDTE